MDEGAFMKNYENKLLERYYIDVNGTRKVREGFLCDTKQGTLMLKELKSCSKKAPYVDYICKQLKENGFEYVDNMLVDIDGGLVNTDREHGDFVLKQWFMGRECDVRRKNELKEAARTLARLHNTMEQVSLQLNTMQKDLVYDSRWDNFIKGNLVHEYARHNSQLRKVRNYIRKKVTKGPFEQVYLKEYEGVYELACKITEELNKSQYNQLYQQAIKEKQLVHGDYNYHNILFTGPNVALTNFEKFKIDVYVSDLYNFLRKVMEKRSWDVALGVDILEAYEDERLLSVAECEYISLRISYPEKFWKITNYYYNTNKAWATEKNAQKLMSVVEQIGEKQAFVEKLFKKNP